MHFLIIGGSGRTGQLLIEQALKEGHTMTALVRSAKSQSLSSLSTNPNLTLVEGSLTSTDMTTAISTPRVADAVFITLNQRRASDSPFAAVEGPLRLMSDAHTEVFTAMRAHHVTRLVTMSAFGAADSNANLNFLLRALFRFSNMKYQYEDHDEVNRRVKEASAEWGLQYTLLRPSRLTDDPLPGTKAKDWGDAGEKGIGMMATASRALVAQTMLECATRGMWINRTPVIASEKA